VFLTLLQTGAGAINVLLLAPVWMQITHLFIADPLWIALVLLTAEVIAFAFPQAEAYAAALWRIGGAFLPQQRLYFSPESQGQGALRGTTRAPLQNEPDDP
jgi:hypothetical protein